MKPVIQETIVVEGTHDSENLKKYFSCETIVTGGLGMRYGVMEEIKAAKQRTGVIIFTDPDGPGAKIRRWIDEAVPGCKHAFVLKENARTKRKVGIEHASYEVLKEALDHTVTWLDNDAEEIISPADMYMLGLSGGKDSEAKRNVLAGKLHIGFSNASTMRKRLNRIGISREEIEALLIDE